MSDSQDLPPCHVCHLQNQQMLMLSCVHDPCINCAAIHYCQDDGATGQSYRCGKCGADTQLDPSSVEQLRKVYAKSRKNTNVKRSLPALKSAKKEQESSSASYYRGAIPARPDRVQEYEPYYRAANTVNAPTRDNQLGGPSLGGATTSYTPAYHRDHSSGSGYQSPTHGTPNYPIGGYPTKAATGRPVVASQAAYQCRQHPEEELTYFCFTCSIPICPECAIHGVHRDHEVQSARKSIKPVKIKLTESLDKLAQQLNSLTTIREQAKKSLKDISDVARNEHQFIRGLFVSLRGVLVEKEKQLLKAVDSTYEQNSSSVKGYCNEVDQRMEGLIGVRKSIEATIRKDDVAVLSEYGRREDEVIGALDSAQGSTDLASVQARNRQINRNSIQQQFDQLVSYLAGIQIDLHSLATK